MALKCIIQLKYVTEAFSLYSDIARCLPPTLRSLTLVSEPCLGAGYVVNSIPVPCSGVGYVVQYTPDIEHAQSEPCYMHACSGEGSALLCIHLLLRNLIEGMKENT